MDGTESLPLLATKLYMPRARENLVVRPRLHYKLSENPDSRLVLITAPAGYGKTTLVTSWLAKQSKKTAWLSLDKNDSDPLIFLSYVAAAMHGIEAGTCKTIRPLLQSSDPPPTSTLLTYFINDLTCLKGPAILVLDDYHAITSPEVDEVAEFLIEHKPPNLGIIITSRRMPDFSISRWRARDEIVEITASDLVFNYDESWHFLHDAMKLKISDKNVDSLREQTEGWVTGLQLAGLGLRSQHRSGDAFIHEMSGDDRLIGDYLVDEVIEQQPIEVRKFLVQTAILRRLSAPLCNPLLEIDNAQEILNHLERSNLFLIPLDNRRIWYRYHHLFGEMLRTRLDQKQPEMVPALYKRAVAWHLENDLIAEAIEYAMAAEDYEQTAVIIEDNFDHFQTGSQRMRIRKWAEAIPETILKEHDVLWSQYIISLFFFADFDIALQTLNHLWHEAPVPEHKVQIVRAIENTLLASITLHTMLDAQRVRELTQEALVLMPEENVLMGGIAKGHFGSASMYLGDLESARLYLTEAISSVGDTFSWSAVIVFHNYLAETLATEGNLRRAAEEYAANQQVVYDRGLQEGHTFAGTLIGLGLLHYEWNELDEAERLIRQGRHLAEPGRSIENMLQACRASIRLQSARGEFPDIKEKLDQIESEAARFQQPPLVMDQLKALRSLLALQEGNHAYAEEWAQSFINRHDLQVSSLQQLEWLTVARIYLADGQVEACLNILQLLHDLALEQNRQRDMIRIGALLARTWYQSGESARGLLTLTDLLFMAEPEGYIRSFVDAGPPLQEMLQELLDSSSETGSGKPSPGYIRLLLDAFPQSLKIPDPIPHMLTPRELEILQLLAEGLSYAQITDRLVITENTLKTHIKRIYSKLHVNNRMQAVLAAQDLGIL